METERFGSRVLVLGTGTHLPRRSAHTVASFFLLTFTQVGCLSHAGKKSLIIQKMKDTTTVYIIIIAEVVS